MRICYNVNRKRKWNKLDRIDIFKMTDGGSRSEDEGFSELLATKIWH
jgi:hypothetical protein